MAGAQHFIYSEESAFGTWVTPDKAIPIETEDIGAPREILDLRTTGAGRGLYSRVLGAKPVNGSFTTYWWQSNIATILSTFMRDTATTGGGDPYTHGFLFDDSQGLLGLSIQKIYKTSAAQLAQNFLSCVVSTWTITAAKKEKVMLNFGIEGKDEGLAGGTWDYDGSACPAVTGTPSALYASKARPFMFYDGTVTIGGTPSLDDPSNVISIGGGTDYAKIENVEISVALNLDTDGYGITADPTRQEIWPGNRDITVSFDISWTDYATTFYTNARAGTAMALELGFAISADREAHIVVPSLSFDPYKLPPVTGDATKKVMTVTGKAETDTTTGYDFNAWVESGESTI